MQQGHDMIISFDYNAMHHGAAAASVVGCKYDVSPIT